MRRRLLTYILLAAVTGVFLWACQRDRFGHDDPNAVKPTLTVSEAQSIFERQMSQAMPTLTKLSNDRPIGLMPGDFTPLWNKARIGANREMDGADVPINPHYIHVAVFRRLTLEGDTLYRTVDVIQKLVVKQWRDTSDFKAYSYIASIVPTPEYYARHKNVGKEFRYAGSKGEFSGFVVYQTLEGIPVAITNYRDGKATRHEYFPRITSQNVSSVAAVMDEIMEGVSFQAGTPAMFGIGTEENPWKPDQEVTVTFKRNSSEPWLITVALHPQRPSGLPPTHPNPNDITYVTPNISSGGNGGTVGETGKPSGFTIKCSDNESKATSSTGTLFSILKQCPKNGYNSPTYSDFINTVNKKPDVEHSMVLKGFSDGSMSCGNIQSADGSDDFISIENNKNNIALLHSHPNSHATAPSPSDIMELGAQLEGGNPSVQASYVIVGRDVYSIQVVDQNKAKQFYRSNSLEGSMFKPESPAGLAWREGTERMQKMQHWPENEVFCAVMAYVLETKDAGMVLSKMGSSDNTFNAYGAKQNNKGQYFPTRCR